jgi:hypothetical protein
MRLLNVSTLQFQEFFDSEVPQYCILSHRWEGNETTYKDFLKGRDSPGYRKITAFCDFVKRHFNAKIGPEWIWVDTC